MKSEPGILERFLERQEQARREAADLDKEMARKRAEYEKLNEKTREKIETARATLAKMKADYLALEVEFAARAAQDLEASAVTAEKVGKGEVSLRQYCEEGQSAKELLARAKAAVAGEMADAMKLIRAKAAEIFQLEYEEANSRVNSQFAVVYPAQTYLEKSKAEIKNMERTLTEFLGFYIPACTDRDRAKANVDLCSDRSLEGLNFDALTYEELKDLRFDPRFTAKFSDQLESCISSMSPGQRCTLILCAGNLNREAGLTFRILDDDGTRRVVTT